MNKKILLINTIFSILICILDIFYITFGGLPLKSVTSAMFVLLAGVNLFFLSREKTKDKSFAITIFVGLVFAMLGDIILAIHFISGAALFAVGHIFYFFSYSKIIKICLKDFLIASAIFIPSVLFITLAPIFDFGGIVMEMVCIIYALIISIMVGKSISNYTIRKSTQNLVIMIGSILFFFSDFMLLLNVFANLGTITDVLCLATYYPAEILLATSILFSQAKQVSTYQNTSNN